MGRGADQGGLLIFANYIHQSSDTYSAKRYKDTAQANVQHEERTTSLSIRFTVTRGETAFPRVLRYILTLNPAENQTAAGSELRGSFPKSLRLILD